MTVSLPIARRSTKCLTPGATAVYLFNEGSGTVLTDRSGNGNHGTLGAAAAAPTWTATGLDFDGGDVVTLPILSLAGEFTIQFVATRTDTAQFDIILGRGNVTNKIGFGIGADTVYIRAVNGGTPTNAPIAEGGTTPRVVTFTRDAAGKIDAWVDTHDPVRLYNDVAQPGTVTYAAIGSDDTGGNYLTGSMYFLAVYPFAMTGPGIAHNYAAIGALLTQHAVTLADPIQSIVTIGDSITLGVGITGVTATTTYPYLLSQLTGLPVANGGVGGNTTAQMAVRLAALIDQYAPPHVVILGGTNDVGTGVAVATTTTNLNTMRLYATNAGAYAILCTVPPSVTYDATENAALADINAWIATKASASVIVVDLHAALKDPATPTQLLAAYDSGDGLHPSAAGLDVIADAVYAALPGA